MIKYTDAFVVFEEIPDKIGLAINISNCQNHCIGCHSPELRRNIGTELTTDAINNLIKENDGINCLVFMGEGNDIDTIVSLSKYVREKYPNISTALYSGREEDEIEFKVWMNFDYVKVGPYKEEFGPLNKETTNQRLYLMEQLESVDYSKTDITYKFWNRQ